MGLLFRGKIGYTSQVLKPRLNDSDPCSTFVAQLQVCICNLARATVGVKKSDRLKVEDLLHKAGFEMVNRKVMYSIAMECWRVLSLRDVPDGPLNPLGAILFTNSSRSLHTRWANSGCLSPPPPKYQTDMFTWWAYTLWNASPPQVSTHLVRRQDGR